MFQTFAFNVFTTFEIENQVDLLRFDWNKVNFHCDNVSKLSPCPEIAMYLDVTYK